jgi:A/G-specific adenine glycosylase
MLLRRTTGSAVLRVYPDFISKYPSPQSLATASIPTISRVVNTLGLQKMRAKHLRAMARELQATHSGEVPVEYHDLHALPGVGRYIANAVLNFAFGIPTSLVDGNILHLISRVFGLMYSGPSDDRAWKFMDRFGGKHQDAKLYWGVIDLVAGTCLRRGPRCVLCPLSRECRWNNNGQQ